MRVIGTAGHVDHGKSTLVRALSGIDPDRLREEKARGLTIDLGFAWADLPAVQQTPPQPTGIVTIGIIDVPGHIDFIKNMLAGVGGIDAALLVIAADEGVMPQTREHLAILDLLAVPTGVVALTKCDQIDDPEWLDLIELDVAEILEETALRDAPIVRVSAQSGTGLDELKAALAQALGELSARRHRARPRLPVDRVFSLSGFGTVVTGTLSDGDFCVGDAVELLPSGRGARIRGLQSHKQAIERAEPGSRLAINLSGVDKDEVARGEVVAKPGTLRPTKLVDVSIRIVNNSLINESVGAVKALVHNQAVDFFSGAAEIPARVRLLGAESLAPGEAGWLQLRLARPAVLAPGDRFILRQPSPSLTLGGGVVLDAHPRRRWKRFNPAAVDRLATLARGTPDEILLQTLARAQFLSETDLIEQSGLDTETAQLALAELRRSDALIELSVAGSTLVAREAWQAVGRALSMVLAEFHAQQPLRRGMARGELRSRLQQRLGRELPVRLFNALLERAAAGEDAGQTVALDEELVWLLDFEVTYSPAQQQRAERTLTAFAQAPFSPPSEVETLKLLGGEEALLTSLIERGELVRMGGVLFRTQDFALLTDKVTSYLERAGAITLAQTRDLLGTSRKYAQAALEELDARRITRRNGDERVLR